MGRKIFLLIAIIVCFANFTKAQKGFIRGSVTDEKTGETLIGVAIKIEGTLSGTITDFDGNYSLQLDPGKYSLNYSYISYQSQTITDIEVKAREVTIMNLCLKETSQTLDVVEIKAKSTRKTEAALQKIQQKSASMLDCISSEQISNLGDKHAAAALKRVTGVSVQNDKYIFVRGLGDRYTKITLNGADIPALDPEKNTVQMDIFPSNIIENVIVHKTFTPDLPGESTGGYVDVATNDFPETFTLQWSSSFSYNPQSNLIDDFLTYEGGNMDWFGMDDGSRDIPGPAQDALDRLISEGLGQIIQGAFTEQELNDISSSFSTEMSPSTKSSFLDFSQKISLGNQIPLSPDKPEKALGYNFALSYSSGYDYYDDGEYGIYDEDINPSPWKIYDSILSGTQNVNINALANISIKLNEKNKIGLRYLRNQNGKIAAVFRDGYFHYESTYDRDRNLSYLERTFDSYQLHGKHIIQRLNMLVANWLVSYTYMNQNEPDLRFFENLYTNPDDTTMRLKTNDKPGRFFRDMKESNINAKIDFELPFMFREKKSKFKFGGGFTYKYRDVSDVKFDIKYDYSFVSTNDIEEFLTTEIISPSYPLGYYYTSDHNQNLNNSYTADQSVIAAYAMADLPLTEKIRVIAGVRIENSNINIANKVSTTDNLHKSGELSEVDPLPSLNLIYSLNDKMNVRIAGSQTIARPVFKEIGTNYYDYKTGIFVTGNQDLERSVISNMDFRWEWFFKTAEKVSASVFYKQFKNPIEQKLSVTTQNFEIQYVNTNDAYLYGLEFEFRKKLEFVPALSKFTLGGNLTLVKSVVEIDPDEMIIIHILDPDRDNKRPMLGQAPYIVNAYLNYHNKDKKLEYNIGFNVTGEKLLIITKGATPYVYEQPVPSLNFNISKGISERSSLEIGVRNILDAEYKAVHHFDKGDFNYLKYSMGRTYSMSYTYLIK